MPPKHLEAEKAIVPETVTVGTVTHKLKVGGNDKLELYDYPGGYAGRFDGINKGGGEQASQVQKIFQDNARTVGIRMQEEAAGQHPDSRPGQSCGIHRRAHLRPLGALLRQRQVRHHQRGA